MKKILLTLIIATSLSSLVFGQSAVPTPTATPAAPTLKQVIPGLSNADLNFVWRCASEGIDPIRVLMAKSPLQNLTEATLRAACRVGRFKPESTLLELQEFLGDTETVKRVRSRFLPMNQGEAFSAYLVRYADEAEVGRRIVELGELPRTSGNTTQSELFKCINCHNPNMEFDRYNSIAAAGTTGRGNLGEMRIQHASRTNGFFAQGAPLAGMINSDAFYTGDYQSYYNWKGTPQKPNPFSDAGTNLDSAIGLCSDVCSKGQRLNEREIRAVRAYLQSKQLKIGNVLTENEICAANILFSSARSEVPAAEINRLKNQIKTYVDTRYQRQRPATFAKEKESYAAVNRIVSAGGGDANRGEEIFERTCMHCHSEEARRTTGIFEGTATPILVFSKNRRTGRYLKRSYEHVRDGSSKLIKALRSGVERFNSQTDPVAWDKNPYMPLYTKEDLSDEQIADLMAYVNQLASGS